MIRTVLVLCLVLVACIGARSALAQCNPLLGAKLIAEDGAEDDLFGNSVAIHGDFALVGAPGHMHEGIRHGFAYFFDVTTGQQTAEVLPEDDSLADQFGRSVAMYGDAAVIGAPNDDENDPGAGAAYVFRYDGSSWVQEAKLLADDGDHGDQLGVSVAIHGDTALVGAIGPSRHAYIERVYVYRHDGSSWVQEAKLLPTDGAPEDEFGLSVAISGDTAVVGANQDDDNGADSGSAYVFRYDGSRWVQTAKLLPEDGAAGDRFGISVAIDGSVALIGAAGDGDNGEFSGSAYLFDTTTGVQIAKLLADDGARQDGFGYRVAIHRETAIIGATLDDDNGFASGSAYVFHYDGSHWLQQAKILPPDGAPWDYFSWSVAIHDETAVIGARLNDENGEDSGAAYLFRLCNCADDADCDDGSDCTDDTCSEGICTFVPNDARCDDGLFCNGAERCLDGSCFPGSNPCPPEQACDEKTDSCRVRVGACCIGGGCLQNLDEGFCEDVLGGVYAGDFTECDEAVCEPGACCLPTGECVDVPEPACADADGEWAGPFTECEDPNICEGCLRDPEWICDGDVDADGQVNPVDSGLVQAAFGSAEEQDLCNYDVDCDGQINPVDSGIVQSLFGTCEEPRDVCP